MGLPKTWSLNELLTSASLNGNFEYLDDKGWDEATDFIPIDSASQIENFYAANRGEFQLSSSSDNYIRFLRKGSLWFCDLHLGKLYFTAGTLSSYSVGVSILGVNPMAKKRCIASFGYSPFWGNCGLTTYGAANERMQVFFTYTGQNYSGSVNVNTYFQLKQAPSSLWI